MMTGVLDAPPSKRKLVCIHVLSLCGKVLEAGVVSVRRVLKLHVRQETFPAHSKMDPLLVRTEPVSDVGFASVKAYLRKGEKMGRMRSEKQFYRHQSQ